MDGRLRRLQGKRQNRDEGITNEITAADSPGAFVEDTPTATLVRQVLAAVGQLDKANDGGQVAARPRSHPQARWQARGAQSHAEERPEAGQRSEYLEGIRGRVIFGDRGVGGCLDRRLRQLPGKRKTGMKEQFDDYRVQVHKVGSRVILFRMGTTSPTVSLQSRNCCTSCRPKRQCSTARL